MNAEPQKNNKVTEAFLLNKAIEQLQSQAANKGLKVVICKAPYFGRFRWDFFGVFDLIAVYNGYNASTSITEFIQVTTKQHLSERRRKILNMFGECGVNIPHSSIWAYDKRTGVFKIEKVIA
jgi:hypothetical protein